MRLAMYMVLAAFSVNESDRLTCGVMDRKEEIAYSLNKIQILQDFEGCL